MTKSACLRPIGILVLLVLFVVIFFSYILVVPWHHHTITSLWLLKSGKLQLFQRQVDRADVAFLLLRRNCCLYFLAACLLTADICVVFSPSCSPQLHTCLVTQLPCHKCCIWQVFLLLFAQLSDICTLASKFRNYGRNIFSASISSLIANWEWFECLLPPPCIASLSVVSPPCIARVASWDCQGFCRSRSSADEGTVTWPNKIISAFFVLIICI